MQSYTRTYYRLRKRKSFIASGLPPGGGGGALIYAFAGTPTSGLAGEADVNTEGIFMSSYENMIGGVAPPRMRPVFKGGKCGFVGLFEKGKQTFSCPLPKT